MRASPGEGGRSTRSLTDSTPPAPQEGGTRESAPAQHIADTDACDMHKHVHDSTHTQGAAWCALARFPIKPPPRGGAEGGECEDKASESLPWRGGAQHPLPHRLHSARPPRGGHKRERAAQHAADPAACDYVHMHVHDSTTDRHTALRCSLCFCSPKPLHLPHHPHHHPPHACLFNPSSSPWDN